MEKINRKIEQNLISEFAFAYEEGEKLYITTS